MSPHAGVKSNPVATNGAKALPGQALEKDDGHASVLRVYEKEFDGFCTYAGSLVGSSELAQDIVQQAFANTLAAIDRGTHIHNEAAFLTRCIRNLAFDHHKGKTDHKSIDDELPRLYERFSDKQLPYLYEKSPFEDIEHKEKWKQLADAVDDLIPSQRRAFLLAEFRGLGYEEIASRMDRSTDSVRMLLNRARHRVRSIVENGTDSVAGYVPAIGAEYKFASNHDGQSGLLAALRSKASVLRDWLGGDLRQSLESLTQQASTPLVAGTMVVALSTAPLGSLLGDDSASTDRAVVQKSNPVVQVMPVGGLEATKPRFEEISKERQPTGLDAINPENRVPEPTGNDLSDPKSDHNRVQRSGPGGDEDAVASGLDGPPAPPISSDGSGDDMQHLGEAPGPPSEDPPPRGNPAPPYESAQNGNTPDGPCGNFPDIAVALTPEKTDPENVEQVAISTDSGPDKIISSSASNVKWLSSELQEVPRATPSEQNNHGYHP